MCTSKIWITVKIYLSIHLSTIFSLPYSYLLYIILWQLSEISIWTLNCSLFRIKLAWSLSQHLVWWYKSVFKWWSTYAVLKYSTKGEIFDVVLQFSQLWFIKWHGGLYSISHLIENIKFGSSYFRLNRIWWALLRLTRFLASIRAFLVRAMWAGIRLRSKSRWQYANFFSLSSISCERFAVTIMSTKNDEINRNDLKIRFTRFEFRRRCQYLRLWFFSNVRL